MCSLLIEGHCTMIVENQVLFVQRHVVFTIRQRREILPLTYPAMTAAKTGKEVSKAWNLI